MKKTLSIIIPAYNEGNYLAELISKIKKVDFSKLQLKYEIIIVDDGSTDNTQEVLSKINNIKIITQKNSGKGQAVQKGIQFSTGDFILIQDADLEYDPGDYYKLLEPFKSQKRISVYGSRPMNIYNKNNLFKDKHNKQGYGPYFMNKLLCFFFKFLFNVNLTDPLTGYKVYEKSFFKDKKILSHGFEADHEITIKLLKSFYKIIEVPINYNPRTVSEGKKIKFIDALIAIYILIKFKLTKKKYEKN